MFNCRSIGGWIGLFSLVLLVTAACSAGQVTTLSTPTSPPVPLATTPPPGPTSLPAPVPPTPQPLATSTPPAQADLVSDQVAAAATPADRWAGLFLETPFPYTKPLPSPVSTILDGVYTKVEDRGTPVPCRRCPDFKPEGGVWKLSLDKGIFRIFYQEKGWRSIASYTIDGDRFTVFNDPNCLDVVGTYTWKVEEGQLLFQVVDDTCHVGRRALNLTSLPWRSCIPANREAAVSDHWAKPPGC